MPRPRKCRRVCALPQSCAFGPLHCGESRDVVEMTVDEYESIRLIDLAGCTQEDCAEQMGVARTTAQAIYNAARKKLADVLVNGKMLVIQGGDYRLCAHSGECCGKKGGCHHENCGHL